MMGFYGYGNGMWLYGLVMMVLFLGVLILVAVWAVRTFTASRPVQQQSAVDVLKRRFGSGEISAEEYERARRTLQS